jgi:hypothetical protein
MVHPPLLRGIQRDTNQQRQSGIFSHPLTRGYVVRVGDKLDSQVAYVHMAPIPLKPDTTLDIVASVHPPLGKQVADAQAHSVRYPL